MRLGMSLRLREGTAPPPDPLPQAVGGVRLELHDVRALGRADSVKARHRLIVDDGRLRHPEAVELGAHGAAVGSEHADLDIVASPDVAGKLERTRHAIEVVAGRAV